jgi:hypothetical protein
LIEVPKELIAVFQKMVADMEAQNKINSGTPPWGAWTGG